MNDFAKRALSIGVFSLGMCIGLYGCAVLPMALFTIGINDSPIATPIFMGCLMFFFPTCLLALWKRRPAALILNVMAISWIAVFVQEHYIVATRGLPSSSFLSLFRMSELALLPLSLGLFGLLTTRAGWPRLLSRRSDAD